MSKRKPPAGDRRITQQEKDEKNHMDRFMRLARVVNMHGHPGVPKPKKSGGK